MTIFECLLDSLPVPDPHAPRYGTLPSPIRVTRRTAPAGLSFESVTGSSPITGVSSSSVLRAGTASPTQRHQPHVSFSPAGSAATSTTTATATATAAAAARVGTAASPSRNRTPLASKQSQAPSLVEDSFASFFDATPETIGPNSLPLETEVVLPPDDQVEATVDLADLEIENQGLQRWTVESVTRCLTGDKPKPPKVYR